MAVLPSTAKRTLHITPVAAIDIRMWLPSIFVIATVSPVKSISLTATGHIGLIEPDWKDHVPTNDSGFELLLDPQPGRRESQHQGRTSEAKE